MRVALICPSNMLYMPYVDNYTKILEENNVSYIIINWDRFGTEESSEFTYRDNKVGHQRSFFDYYRYYKFVVNLLDSNYFDKIIVFGLQMAFFLNRYLIKDYKDKYIIDIRDYNKILKVFSPRKVIENSAFTVISSPWYKQWLPKSNKFFVNHNTQIKSLSELVEADLNDRCNKINISCIGAIRDFKINIDFINTLANNESINLYYHGEGEINKKIIKHLSENNINNVIFTGRYARKDEAALYLETDLINVLRYNDSINNYTALPNRLYNAALYGKPIIALDGTCLAKVIKKYNLGLVVRSFENIEVEIYKYIKKFDIYEYNRRRNIFFEKVIDENKVYGSNINMFINK